MKTILFTLLMLLSVQQVTACVNVSPKGDRYSVGPDGCVGR